MPTDMLPGVSVIIPTYNEESKIARCLGSIVRMYPREKLDIIIVDDGSTDNTIKIAEEMGARILHNGTKHIERGKSIGIENAKEEYLLFVDADNEFTSPNWLKDAIRVFEENPRLVGVQPGVFEYRRADTLPNRYSTLFGVNDPFVFYLGRRGMLMYGEEEWPNPDTLVKKSDRYFLVRFTTENMPTLGSQGFLIKKSQILRTDWRPHFFHMDSLWQLVSQGENLFAMTRGAIYHDYAVNSRDMFRKWRRNIDLFHRYSGKRKYTYDLTPLRLVKTILIIITLIIPIVDALKGYGRNRDTAWLMHPIYCVVIVGIYAFSTIEHLIGNVRQKQTET